MEYATFMWVKARFDAAEKRVEALDGRVHELAVAVLSLVATLQTQGAAQMEQVTRIEIALADLKVREQALLERDSARDAAATQAAADLVVAQAKVQAIQEQLAGVSADREALKAQLDDLNSHLDTMAVNAEAARDALPPVPVAVDPNLGATNPDVGAADPNAATASAPAATATPPDPAQQGSADPTGAAPTGQSAGDTSVVGTPTVVNENVSDGATIKDPAA